MARNTELEKEIMRLKIALQKSRQRERGLKKQLDSEKRSRHIDPMTGLRTLSGIMEEARNHFRIWKRHMKDGTPNGPLSVIFIDMDNLKTVNDTYGHDEGDHLIKEMAFVLESQLREEDLLCRRTTSGDEFIIILPHENEKNTRLVVRKIQRAFKNSACKIGGKSVPLLASLGEAEASTKTATLKELLKAAEDKMYQRKKRAGKGR